MAPAAARQGERIIEGVKDAERATGFAISRERERLRVIFTMARVEIAIGFAARG